MNQPPQGRSKRLLRSDLLLALLVLILAALTYAHFGSGTAGLRELPPAAEELPLEATADDGAIAVEEVDEGELPRAGEAVRFLMHNTRNYFVAGERQRSRYTIKPKPEAEREAVAEVIAHAAPDIVGLIEIGGEKALADLRARLAKRGLDYPHAKLLARGGEDRALALLSRHPIVADHSRAEQKLYGDHRRRMLRGILDVTVQLPDGRQFRIVGAHLKSRVATDAAAAASLRAKEAHTLALHLQEAMRLQPNMPIAVYGDWNDGPSDASLGVLKAGINEGSALTRLKPADSRGEQWTLHYAPEHQYCTFDQIYVNKVLQKRMGGRKKSASGIIDIPAAKTASDHRALWCELR